MRPEFKLTWKDYFAFSFSWRRMIFGYTAMWQNLRCIFFYIGPIEFGIYFRHGNAYMPKAQRQWLLERMKNAKDRASNSHV